jgi:hypothetical protein
VATTTSTTDTREDSIESLQRIVVDVMSYLDVLDSELDILTEEANDARSSAELIRMEIESFECQVSALVNPGGDVA